jgi:hypothetical protein
MWNEIIEILKYRRVVGYSILVRTAFFAENFDENCEIDLLDYPTDNWIHSQLHYILLFSKGFRCVGFYCDVWRFKSSYRKNLLIFLWFLIRKSVFLRNPHFFALKNFRENSALSQFPTIKLHNKIPQRIFQIKKNTKPLSKSTR